MFAPNNVCHIHQMVSTTLPEWGIIPDIIGDGVSEQETIMTVICETKGARFDGADCVGDLDNSTVHVSKQSNVTLDSPCRSCIPGSIYAAKVQLGTCIGASTIVQCDRRLTLTCDTRIHAKV